MKTVFGQMPLDTFLSEYWQKKPCLFRQAWPDIDTGLDINDIAGLALEEDIESRLVEEKPSAARDTAARWQLYNGPFTEERLTSLPESHWTLLVQAVDQVLPDVHDWLNAIDFLPKWRVDDIMISIAAPKGTVGPHFDHYDVFLLQAEGKRRWQVGAPATPTTSVIADAPLKIVTEFTASEGRDWVLHPGDVLYIPPLYTHYGVAETTGTTWSFGFRAPEAADVLHGLATRLLIEDNAEFLRYADPDLSPAETRHGELNSRAVSRLRELIIGVLDNDTLLADWLGSHMTGNKYEVFDPDITADELPSATDWIAPALPSRFVAWDQRLYTNGRVWPLSTMDQPLIDCLTRSTGPWRWGELCSMSSSEVAGRALEWLWASGSLETGTPPLNE